MGAFGRRDLRGREADAGAAAHDEEWLFERRDMVSDPLRRRAGRMWRRELSLAL